MPFTSCVVQTLSECGICLDFKSTEYDGGLGRTLLHYAALRNSCECAEYLIEKFPNLLRVHDFQGRTPAHVAADACQYECLRICLINGAPVDASDNSSHTPAHLAARTRGGAACLRLLFKHGASPSARNDVHQQPVHMAAKKGECECLRVCLEYGADIDALGIENQTLLHCAAWSGDVDCVSLLLEKGAGKQINATDRTNSTPLHMAVVHAPHLKVLQTLLSQETIDCINAKDMRGKTAAHYAADHSDSRNGLMCLKALLNHGADVNVTDQKGNTLVHMVVHLANAHCVEMLKLLRSKGAKMNAENNEGTTPVQIVCRKGAYLEIEQLQNILDVLNRHNINMNTCVVSQRAGRDLTMRD